MAALVLIVAGGGVFAIRILAALTIALFLTSCDKFKKNSEKTDTTATFEDKSMAEKAGEAGLKARKKAEKIKAEEDKKAKETNDAMND